MGLIIGQTTWWVNELAVLCPVGTVLPDGSRIICKAGGTAWIVAPNSIQVGQTWNNSTSTLVGDKCCICDWPTLCSRMISCGFNPCDWFVPSCAQLNNPGYVCRTLWDTFASSNYWSSTEVSSTNACTQSFSNGTISSGSKTTTSCVRPFRCVTY